MKDKFKSFFGAIGYLGMFFLIQIAVSIVGGIIIGIMYTVNNIDKITSNGPDIESIANQMTGLTNYIHLASSIITVLIFLLIYKVRKKKITQELKIVKTKKINLVIAMILGISVWLFNTGVLSLIEGAGLLTKYFEAMNEMMAPLMEGNIVISMIAIGIAAPFVEEFIFRGVIYKTLSKNISIKWTIIIQAVLFGVIHGNLIQGTYATILGVIFGYVTYKTKSLWPAIIIHTLNNLVAVVLPMLLPESIAGAETYIGFSIIGVIGILISILFIVKKNISVENDMINITDYRNLN